MAQWMDGKLVSKKTREKIRQNVSALTNRTGVVPTLAVVLVGDDPASAVYVRNKERACAECKIRSVAVRLPSQIDQQTLLAEIDKLNADCGVHGILVQLPLPSHIRQDEILRRVDPAKDVDAFHPLNVGLLVQGRPRFCPCTPSGIMVLLAHYGIDVCGKHCVVVGRSDIVGKPMLHLMLAGNATVTICHSHTRELARITGQADILIVAVGKPAFVTGEMVKPGAVVVDVGINRTADGKLMGDVDFTAVEPIASYITPVPGGVGPMTVTMLMENTLRAAEGQLSDGQDGNM